MNSEGSHCSSDYGNSPPVPTAALSIETHQKRTKAFDAVRFYYLFKLEYEFFGVGNTTIAPGLLTSADGGMPTFHEFLLHIIPETSGTYRPGKWIIMLDTRDPVIEWAERSLTETVGYPGPDPKRLHKSLKELTTNITDIDIYDSMHKSHEACYKEYKSMGERVHGEAYKDLKEAHRALFSSYNHLGSAVSRLGTEHIVGIGLNQSNPGLKPAFDRGENCYLMTLDMKDPNVMLDGLKPDRQAYWSEPLNGGPSRKEILIRSLTIITRSVGLQPGYGFDFYS